MYPNGRYRIYFYLVDRTDYPAGWATDAAHHSFERKRLKTVYIQYAPSGSTFVDPRPGPNQNTSQTIKQYELTYESDPAKVIFPGYTYGAGGRVSTLSKVQEFGAAGVSSLPAHTFTYGDKLHLTQADNGYAGTIQFEYDSPQPWFYETATIKDYKVVDEIESSIPWSARGSSYVYVDTENGTIKIGGTAVRSGWLSGSRLPLLRPGGVYRLTATMSAALEPGKTVSLGASFNGVNDIYSQDCETTSIEISCILSMPADATLMQTLIKTTGGIVTIGRIQVELLPSFYRVMEKQVSDGQNHTYPYQYTYAGAAVNDSIRSDVCALGEPDCESMVEAYSEFRGHSQVTETNPDGLRTITTFGQDDIRKGRPSRVLVTKSAGTKLTETINSTASITLPMEPITHADHIGFGRYWVYPTSTENRLYAADGSYTATLTEYTYNTNGSYSYGNLLGQTEYYWDTSAWQKYRRTANAYFANTSGVYLVGLPGYTNRFDGSDALIGQTLYFYDSHTNYSDLPATGVLTDTRTSNGASGYIHTRYGYDGWGNQTTVTTYSGYNAVTTNTPPTGGRTSYTCYGTGGTLGGKSCTDDGLHTYALWTKNPLGQVTTWTYDYSLGVPLSESDPNDPNPALDNETNNTTITAQYDTFGRMKKLIRPGDDAANPTLRITYNDTIQPYRIDLEQRLEGTRYYTIRKYYDGMGRLLQSRTWNAQIAGQADNKVIAVNYEYDAAGRVTRQSAPFTLALGAGYSPDFPSPTVTTYDLLGRPLTVTAPDGNDVAYSYDGLSSIVTDANGNSTTTLNDEWGRVKSVTPSTGPSVSYTYNALDQLLTAVRGGLTTSLSYDRAGRKTSMSDPDMGYWQYGYDALGNLISQTDARNCVLTLTYDILSRLTSKTSTGACGTQVNTTFTYDVGTNSKGRRSEAENTVDNIISAWTYDARGRVRTETVMGSTTEWSYNSADLPIWMKYPDGEVVNYTYNNQMLLNDVRGAEPYVQSTSYDEASRVVERALGNDQVQHYNYYAWNEKATVDAQQTGQGGRLKNLSIGNLQNFTYIYDAVGNIRTISDPLTNETQTFGYDTLDRLTSATVTGGNAPYQEKYSYDAATGNLLSKTSDTYTPPSPNPGTNGLAAWWSMDETSGTRLDSHNENHLKDNNTVASTTGLRGKAASFAASSLEYLSAPDNPLLSGGDIDFTLIAHVYLNNTTNSFIILDKSDNVSAYDYRVSHVGGTGFRFRAGAGSAYVDSGAVTANAWHTVIAWHDSVNDTINIQVDNGTVNSLPFSGGTLDTANPLGIGASSTGYTALNGRVDEVALYKRLLTPEERAWFHNNGQGRVYAGLGSWYTYGDAAHAHAVTSLLNGNSYNYDANGNQVKRVVGGTTYLLSYDAENRLSKVCKETTVNGTCDAGEEVAAFTYDADGKRVKSVIGSETIVFIGAHYEITNPGVGQTTTKYYFAGAQRVAMRKYVIPSSMTVEYMAGDHLGSTSLTTDVNGAKVSEIRYRAWGEIRYSWTSGAATTPAYKLSSYTFTGQYSDSYINLLWYGSRHYDPALGRFIQPDSIVPTSAQGVQAYDRYAYVSNNPVRYTDPTGHMMTEGCGDEGKSHCHASDLEIAINAQKLAKLQQGVYDRKCAAGNSAYCSGWSNSSARLIIGFHAGAGVTMDLGYGGYTYDQTDLVFDFKSGTFYVMKTTGEGTYVGVPNGAALEGYVGTTNVHGIPSSATPDQVADLLAGPNMDIAGDIGLDLLPDVETSVGKGLSVDLDPDTGAPITTTAGPMYTTETKIGAGVSLLPLPIDFGGQGGHSETVVPVFYQLPFWPFR